MTWPSPGTTGTAWTCAFMSHFTPKASCTVFYLLLPTNLHDGDLHNLICTQEETEAQRFKYHAQGRSTSKCQSQKSNPTVCPSKGKFSTIMLSVSPKSKG